MTVPFNFPNSPLIDIKTGMPTAAGRAFFNGVYTSAGGSTSGIGQVTDLTASGGPNLIQLQWIWPTDPSVLDLSIYRLQGTGIYASATQIATHIKGSSYNDVNVTQGVEYSYWVVSRNNGGTSTPVGPVVGEPGQVVAESQLEIEINGNPLSTGTTLVNFTGQNITGVSRHPGQSEIAVGGVNFIYEGVEAQNIDNIVLEGDLSMIYGNPPQIVQQTTISNTGGTVTLSMTNPMVVGNVILVAASGETFGAPSLVGGTQICASTNMSLSYTPVTASSQGIVVNAPNAAGSPNAFIVASEISGFASFGPSYQNEIHFSGSTSIETPSFGSSNIAPSAFYGMFFDGIALSTISSNFNNPVPFTGTIMNTLWAGPGFEGGPAIGADVFVPYENNPTQMGITVPNEPGTNVGQFVGVQLIGEASGSNTVTIVGTPTLVVDGHTILPTIQTEGMLDYLGNGSLGAFIEIENSGTVTNTLATTLNFTGGGVTTSGTAAVETISVPGVSFSGTTIVDIVPGTGLSGTVTSGTLTLTNTESLTGVSEIVKGTNTSTGVITLGSNMSLSGQTINSGSGLSITDGTQTISSLTELIVTDLSLSAEYTAPSVVQSVTGHNTTTAQLPLTPQVGNYILLLTTRSANAAPSGYAVLVTGAGWSGAYSGYYAQSVGGVYSGGANPTFTVTGSNWTLLEITNVSAVGSATAGSNTTSGLFTVSGNTASFNSATVGANNSTSFWIYGEAEQNHYGVSAVGPAGSVIVGTMTTDAYSYSAYTPGIMSETPTFSVTLSSPPTPGGFAQVTLTGVAGGTAQITPTLPIYAGGTLIGGAQTLSQGSGATFSLSGTNLTIGATGGGGGGVTEIVQGTLSATGAITLGSNLSLSGQTINATGGISAEVGTVVSSFGTLDAGSNISFSGTAPNLTIAASSTVSSNITIENAGTSIGTVGTINASTGLTAAVAGSVATFTASGGGGYSRPALSAFTWINQATATATDNTGGPLTISAPSSSVVNICALGQSAGGVPFTLTALVSHQGAGASGIYEYFGLVISNASSGKVILFMYDFEVGRVAVFYNTLPNTYSSTPFGSAAWAESNQLWFRVQYTGTNLIFSVSIDNYDWTILTTLSATAWLASITNAGFGMQQTAGNVGFPSMVKLLNWSLSTP